MIAKVRRRAVSVAGSDMGLRSTANLQL